MHHMEICLSSAGEWYSIRAVIQAATDIPNECVNFSLLKIHSVQQTGTPLSQGCRETDVLILDMTPDLQAVTIEGIVRIHCSVQLIKSSKLSWEVYKWA